MTILNFPGPEGSRSAEELTPAQAIERVVPERRAFAVALGDGAPNVSRFCREHDMPRKTFYLWQADQAVQAYVRVYRLDVVMRGRDALLAQVLRAIETINWAQRAPNATPTNLRAAELALALVGLSKEAALPKHAPPVPDPVVNVTLHVPTNPNTAAIQAERRRRREQDAIDAAFDGPPPA